MKRWASSPSGNEPASQAPQTTPPAAPENPTRCSCSPQLAQEPSCGASPAASSSFRRNASAPPALCGGRVGDAALRVEDRQLPAQQVEHAGMGLGGLEQAAHRVARARRGVDRPRVAAKSGIPVDRLRPRHRHQLPPAFVQLDVQAEERLEAATEAAAGAPDALRDRSDPAAGGRVEVQDAVGLAVAHRTQHNRLCLDRSRHLNHRV